MKKRLEDLNLDNPCDKLNGKQSNQFKLTRELEKRYNTFLPDCFEDNLEPQMRKYYTTFSMDEEFNKQDLLFDYILSHVSIKAGTDNMGRLLKQFIILISLDYLFLSDYYAKDIKIKKWVSMSIEEKMLKIYKIFQKTGIFEFNTMTQKQQNICLNKIYGAHWSDLWKE